MGLVSEFKRQGGNDADEKKLEKIDKTNPLVAGIHITNPFHGWFLHRQDPDRKFRFQAEAIQVFRLR